MSNSHDRLVIDGQDAQLDGRLALNFQGADLLDQIKIREPYTYTISLSNSRRNQEILGFPSDPGADPETLGAYEDKPVDIYIGGALLLQNGKIALASTGDKIRLNVTGRGVGFWDAIADKSIRDLDYGAEESWQFGFSGQPTHRNTTSSLVIYPNIETWISPDYTIASPSNGTMNFNKEIARDDHLIPFIKKARVMEQICTDAGYTINWDRLRLNAGEPGKCLENSYISLKVPQGKKTNYVDDVGYAAAWSPEISQVDFMKGILYQYGATLVVVQNVVYLTLWDEINDLKARALDWSKKLDKTQEPERTYDVGYGHYNVWRYPQVIYEMRAKLQTLLNTNSSLNAVQNLSDVSGYVQSNNKNLDEVKIIGEIPWSPIMQFEIEDSNGSVRQVCHLPAWNDSTSTFSDTYETCDLVVPDTAPIYKDPGGATQTWSGLGIANGDIFTAWHGEQDLDAVHLTTASELHGLSMSPRLIPYFYDMNATRFIRKPLMIKARMNLDVMDVRPFANVSTLLSDLEGILLGQNRIRPIWVEDLNGFFHVQKISGFIAGSASNVILIRL